MGNKLEINSAIFARASFVSFEPIRLRIGRYSPVTRATFFACSERRTDAAYLNEWRTPIREMVRAAYHRRILQMKRTTSAHAGIYRGRFAH